MLRILLLGGFLLLAGRAAAQNRPLVMADLYNKTWRVDQFYVDSVRILDMPSVDSVRFVFRSDGTATVGSSGQNNAARWQLDQPSRRLALRNPDGTPLETLEVVHLRNNTFVFIVRTRDVNTNQEVIAEFRLIAGG
jgi:hypothetical protein